MIRDDVKEKTSLENDIKLAKFRELAIPKQIRTRKNEKLQEQRRKENFINSQESGTFRNDMN